MNVTTAAAGSPAEQADLVTKLVGDRAGEWDRAGALPVDLLRRLGADGLLCAEVPVEHGGLGWTSLDNGEFTAHTGALCSSLRSVQTSQGMAAWTVRRLAEPDQQAEYLGRLTGGELAAVGFSEPHAGSDLVAMSTTIRPDGDSVVVDGHKVWVTAAHYADLLVVFGRYTEGGGAVVVVPADAPGVRVERVADPLGCRAAGHAAVFLDSVRVPASAVLGAGAGLGLLVASALAYGRKSVAWGCVGILRACRDAAARHAATREQFGRPLAEHQLVARHLATLVTGEQVATRLCEHASRCWDSGSPESVIATLLAKNESARRAAEGAAAAVQVLASAGARDGHVVARAYRDAKLMEIIEGSTEMCELLLAEHVVRGVRDAR
ncbi:acyl-CoA dehydrogenase family protein [Umezawaea sp. Da 62-37]|uniref:acyl-CoA dehydrogenase family protein n=1 Tax=Umezawaea sp. Da 62-37 TaxID=3075927 RepID=UPI0028F6E55D|nr:acyl-CoA dehydrogenase family protein [Umezawaea sp. Da 62-37]WNV86280.1 acyl-CoA dehydrogenase family protein [Umezawaea sp. Da 62-37]